MSSGKDSKNFCGQKVIQISTFYFPAYSQLATWAMQELNDRYFTSPCATSIRYVRLRQRKRRTSTTVVPVHHACQLWKIKAKNNRFFFLSVQYEACAHWARTADSGQQQKSHDNTVSYSQVWLVSSSNASRRASWVDYGSIAWRALNGHSRAMR